MPNEQVVYKQAVVNKAAQWTNADISYTLDSLYVATDKPKKIKPHMKCRSCGNIFPIDDDLFDEDHCTFDCKYNKSTSEEGVE